jgi:acid phosphatase (class A)
MKPGQRRLLLALATALAVAALIGWFQQRDALHYLAPPDATFITQFPPPSTPESAATRDELLAMQATRTAAQVEAARADRKTRIERFYGALGLAETAPPDLPRLQRLAKRVEEDVRFQVRVVKDHYRRLRPYEIEPRLEPCIDNVQGDLSYPSGHAAYAWSMAYLLAEMVPERRAALEARAAEFARQRMMCGVHFRSDLEAGRHAARLLLSAMDTDTEFRAERAAATAELRAALGLGPLQSEARPAEAGARVGQRATAM